MSEVILKTTDLVREYDLPRPSIFSKQSRLRVLHSVSIELAAGRSLGIVGESGSGKSTLARAVMGLERPQSGEVNIAGKDIYTLDRAGLREARKGFQAIFQDPYGSLDPRHTVRTIISEPIVSLERGTGTAERNKRIAEVLEAVGLPLASVDKYPHEFSGGQRQRIAIARALITRPALIVADEPVSALDVSIQAQVLNLMMDLQEKLGLSYLFISHDLGVVRAITDRVAVMHLGRIVEEGPTAEVFDNPRHPYTQGLLRSASPILDSSGEFPAIPGSVPNLRTPPLGCRFHPRCPYVMPKCRTEDPRAVLRRPGENAACWLYDTEAANP